MRHIETRDGARIFFKDWGHGNPIVFSHGWPLNADVWDDTSFFVAQNGFRAIAHDRRGHGRSTQTSEGNDMDTYADELATLLEQLDLRDVVLVGHSTGGGEVTRYMGRHGTSRVRGAVLVSAIPPLMLQTPTNPGGVPRAVFDEIRESLLRDRAAYYRELAQPFFGTNRPGSRVSQGVLDTFWQLSMQAGLKGAYKCVKVFSETDLTDDLARIDVPVLVVHGDDDQIVPIENSAQLSSRQLRQGRLLVYPGAPHGLFATHKERLHQDLLAFLRSLDPGAS